MMNKPLKSKAEASISPDRGDDRVGVTVTMNNHRQWMTRSEANTMVNQVSAAITAADRIVRRNS